MSDAVAAGDVRSALRTYLDAGTRDPAQAVDARNVPCRAADGPPHPSHPAYSQGG